MRIKYLYIFFIFAGICCVGIGVNSYMSSQQLVREGVTVDGKVIEIQKLRSRSGGYTYKPIINYTDHTGYEREFVPNHSSDPPGYFKGERVELIYNPSDPKYPINAKIKDFMGLYGLAAFMICFGLFFIIVSSLVWYIDSEGGVIYFRKKSENI